MLFNVYFLLQKNTVLFLDVTFVYFTLIKNKSTRTKLF